MTDQQHVLYRSYDARGRLLYIGITLDVSQRFANHHGKSWWPDVATIRLEHFATRPELEAAESAAIMAEKPLYNTQRTFRSPVQRESSRRQKRLPKDLQFSYELVRRYAHRHRDDKDLRLHVERARSLGVSDEDIEWALDHPWSPQLATKEPDHV